MSNCGKRTDYTHSHGVALRKNSNSLNVRYDIIRSTASKNTPTEYLRLIIVGMVIPYETETPEVSVPGGGI